MYPEKTVSIRRQLFFQILIVAAILVLFCLFFSNLIDKGATVADEKLEQFKKENTQSKSEMKALINDGVQAIDNNTKDRLTDIHLKSTEIKTTIIKEIKDDPAIVTNDQVLPEAVFNALNKAREETE